MRTSDWYILQGRDVVPADSATWSQWIRTYRENKIVRQEAVGDRFVSTVFLGLDHQYGDGPPLVFETMVFESKDDFTDIYGCRCSTYDEAEAMHEKACVWVRDGEPEEQA